MLSRQASNNQSD